MTDGASEVQTTSPRPPTAGEIFLRLTALLWVVLVPLVWLLYLLAIGWNTGWSGVKAELPTYRNWRLYAAAWLVIPVVLGLVSNLLSRARPPKTR